MATYPDYKHLKLDWPVPHVLRLTLDNGRVNQMNYDLHHDICEIWPIISRDHEVSVVIVTGAGDYFSAGGDFLETKKMPNDYDFFIEQVRDARELVQNMMNCNKPIIAAINGPVAGAGLAVAMMSDFTVAGRSVTLLDGHTRLGIAAGDHAALVWPMLMSFSKAKYYMMTCQPISAPEAERIGMLTECVDDQKVMERALEMAEECKAVSQTALRWTKMAMNGWLRQAWPIFEASSALESVGIFSPDLQEGLGGWLEKRPHNHKPNSPAG